MTFCIYHQLKDGKLTKEMDEFGLLGMDEEFPLYNEIVSSFQSAATFDNNSIETLKNVRDVVKSKILEIHKLEERIKDNKIFRNYGDTEDEKSKSSKTKTKSKGKGGRPKGKSLKTIQRYNWIRDKYDILRDKRSGSTLEEFAGLIYSELREKTPRFFNTPYKKSTILKVLKNRLWAEE